MNARRCQARRPLWVVVLWALQPPLPWQFILCHRHVMVLTLTVSPSLFPSSSSTPGHVSCYEYDYEYGLSSGCLFFWLSAVAFVVAALYLLPVNGVSVSPSLLFRFRRSLSAAVCFPSSSSLSPFCLLSFLSLWLVPLSASLFLFTSPYFPSLPLTLSSLVLSCWALQPRGLSCLESFTFYCRIILSRLAQTQRFTTKSSSLVTLTQTPGLSPYTDPDPDPDSFPALDPCLCI